MALATTCPSCNTSFKVVPDQLKLRRGLVRCGMCQLVFSGVEFLRYVADTRPRDPASGERSKSAPDTVLEDLKTAFFLPETRFIPPGTPAPFAPPVAAPPSDPSPRAALPAAPQAVPPGIPAATPQSTPQSTPLPIASKPTIAGTAASPAPIEAGRRSAQQPSSFADPSFRGQGIGETSGPDSAGPDLKAPDSAPARLGSDAADSNAPALADRPQVDGDADRDADGDDDRNAAEDGGRRRARGSSRSARRRSRRRKALSERSPADAQSDARPLDDNERAALARIGMDGATDGRVESPAADHEALSQPDSGNWPSTAIWPTTEEREAVPVTRSAPRRAAEDPSAAQMLPRVATSGAPALAAAVQARPADMPAAPFAKPTTDNRFDGRRDPGDDLDAEFDDGEDAIDFFGRTSRPVFDFDLPPRSTWIAAAGLALMLALQLIVGARDGLAARFPAAHGLIAGISAPFGMSVALPIRKESVTIESFDLINAPATEGGNPRYAMNLLLRNHASLPLQWPAIELTLTNSTGAILVRKVIQADQYLADPAALERGIAPRSERALRLTLEAEGIVPSGYSAILFYP